MHTDTVNLQASLIKLCHKVQTCRFAQLDKCFPVNKSYINILSHHPSFWDYLCCSVPHPPLATSPLYNALNRATAWTFPPPFTPMNPGHTFTHYLAHATIACLRARDSDSDTSTTRDDLNVLTATLQAHTAVSPASAASAYAAAVGVHPPSLTITTTTTAEPTANHNHHVPTHNLKLKPWP